MEKKPQLAAGGQGDMADVERLPSGVPVAPPGMERKVRLAHFRELKRIGRRITMSTAYDAPFAAMADEAGIDSILVGDSVGNTVHGMETTLPVTMDMMVLHTRAVRAGARRSFVVSDMPFLSYQAGAEDAVRNAGRLLKEGGAEAVKLESLNESTIPVVAAITDAGIPVMGHVGLVPQAVHALSGYGKQGREETAARRLKLLADALEKAGAFAVVLENVPAPLGAEISAMLSIPTIGIGAGPGCDGQVLVMHDLLGLSPSVPPFAKKYMDLRAGALRAFRKYARDVREGHFPPGEE